MKLDRSAMAVLTLIWYGCAFGTGTPLSVDPANLPEVVTWEDHVAAIFEVHCVACHGDYLAVEDYDFTQIREVTCDFDEVRDQLLAAHPPGGSPKPDAWEKAIVLEWEAQGFPLALDGDGSPIFAPEACGGGQ